MKVASDWKDYEILDMADGEKLERWGNFLLIRPDPQIIWKEKSFKDKWGQANARYNRSNKGGGGWQYKKRLPESWQIKYKNLT
ncbi:MAG: SAM-dependent methyltransferase, partial [Clostridia bacterium]|nr:SAM-dependent methyltransferase [Clostridia bacterium]